jgi:hypothetical protein
MRHISGDDDESAEMTMAQDRRSEPAREIGEDILSNSLKHGPGSPMTAPAAIGDGAESVEASMPDADGESRHDSEMAAATPVSQPKSTPMTAPSAIGDGAESTTESQGS